MAQADKRPRRVSSSGVLVLVVAVAFLLALVLVLDHPVFADRLSKSLGMEVFKLLLQFLLITVIGGGVFAYIAARRDEQSRVEARIAGLQVLIRELGDAWRATKWSKRNMRAKLRREGGRSARIERSDFEAAIKDVLDAQIVIEEVREHIAVRSDLLEPTAGKRIDSVLRYAARYLHDVYEDHEKARVRRDGEDFVVDTNSPNLFDFLIDDTTPKALMPREEDVLEARFQALARIEADRDKIPHGQRYGAIASESFRVVMAQLRANIAERLGH